MASLAVDQPIRTRPESPVRATGELIDARAIAADLEKLAKTLSGNDRELRTALAKRLKEALNEGRAKAEQLLLKDRHGRACAERLCRMEDEIIRILFEFAKKHLYQSQNPTDSEHMAVVATGGYGRGLQAPGSDIDLLFLLPYKQTAWGESIAEAILYCPVGHRPESRPRHPLGRRMHPPGQSGHDHPHRHSRSALSARRPARCTTNWSSASTTRWCAIPARNSSPPSSPSAKSACAAPANRAIWSSRT